MTLTPEVRIFIVTGVITVALLWGFIIVNQHQADTFVAKSKTKPDDFPTFEVPRTDEPMGPFTQFFDKKQFEIDDHARKHIFTYYWMQPSQPYPATQKFPLVVVLHGGPGRAYAAAYYLDVPGIRQDFPAYILVPMIQRNKMWALPAHFPDHQYLPDVIAMINQMERDYPIDPARVYILGCSDGGIGAYAAALRYSNTFAATVPMSSIWWDVNDAAQMVHVPMWVFHGAQDTTYPVATTRAIVDSIKSHGGNVLYAEFPDMGHACPAPAFYTREMWQWLFSQRKS